MPPGGPRTPEHTEDKGGPAFFAVKTTIGKEKEVADGLRDRALKEKMALQSVLAPGPMRGYVFVETDDFDRLTNLASSVRHSRGVVRARADPDNPLSSAVPIEQLEPFLKGGEAQLPKALDVELPPGPFRSRGEGSAHHPQPGQSPAGRQGPASGPAPAGAPKGRGSPGGGELPHPNAAQSRLLNLAILVPLAGLLVGLLVAPRLVWDGFLEPYFWRSIEADANNVGGAAEAYNVVDTLAYALILVPAVLLIYRVLEKLKVRVDARFVFMLTPFLVLGGAARALEDAQYFHKPLVYGFISPIIYLAEGLLVLLLVVASWWVGRAFARSGPRVAALAWAGAFAPGAAALAWLHIGDPRFVVAPLPAPIVASALACAYLGGLAIVTRPQGPSVHGLVFNAGLLLLGLTAYLVVRWVALGGWYPDPAFPAATHSGEVPTIVGLAFVATALTWAGFFLASRRFPALAALLTPINALVFFAQFLDGAATFWGVDAFGYEEKHVLPGFLMGVTGTAAVMFPLKLAYVSLVLVLTDVVFRKDLFAEDGSMSSFAGLLKLAVAALGMGPGTRDMLRLSMGV